ncbi:MAG TPA: hypothetical protein VK714_11480 [Myxococcota bacterium]|nr:hypothetical protein [Myxococcota bacterium]
MWLSIVPLDGNEGAKGRALLEVEVAASLAELPEFECVEEGKPYRKWLIPAAWLNERAIVRNVSEQEIEDAERGEEGGMRAAIYARMSTDKPSADSRSRVDR